MSSVQIPAGFATDATLATYDFTKTVVMGFPPNATAASGVKATYLCVGCDGGRARFRVGLRGAAAVHWTVHDITVESGGVVSIPLPAGVSFASIMRAPFTAADKADAVPVAFWSWSSAA